MKRFYIFNMHDVISKGRLSWLFERVKRELIIPLKECIKIQNILVNLKCKFHYQINLLQGSYSPEHSLFEF